MGPSVSGFVSFTLVYFPTLLLSRSSPLPESPWSQTYTRSSLTQHTIVHSHNHAGIPHNVSSIGDIHSERHTQSGSTRQDVSHHRRHPVLQQHGRSMGCQEPHPDRALRTHRSGGGAGLAEGSSCCHRACQGNGASRASTFPYVLCKQRSKRERQQQQNTHLNLHLALVKGNERPYTLHFPVIHSDAIVPEHRTIVCSHAALV
jgi:hypothetical protein